MNIKPITICAFLFLSAQLLFAQGVQFEHGAWEDILSKAKTEKKLIFMDAYTTWCGPCKMMSRNVFPNSNVGDFFNENFISVKMDMEHGEGVDLAKKYTVVAYPTLLFLDSDGEVIHRTAGYYGVEAFIDLGKTALAPERRLSGLNARYAKGERDADFMQAYTEALSFAMDNRYMDIANEYMEAQGDLGTSTNMDFIMQFIDDPNSKGFEYFVANRSVFDTKYGFDATEGKVQGALGAFIEKDPTQPFENVEKIIRKLYPKKGEEMASSFKMAYARQNGDRPGYTKAAIAHFDKYPSKDPDELNEAAWTFYQITEDKKELKKALKWAKKSVKINTGYYNMDTVAALYFKLKKRKKAIKYARKAIDLARANGEDFTETQRILDEAYKL